MLLNRLAIFLHIFKLLKLTLNVSANLLYPECRRLHQNTKSIGTTVNGHIAQDRPFAFHL